MIGSDDLPVWFPDRESSQFVKNNLYTYIYKIYIYIHTLSWKKEHIDKSKPLDY